MNYPTSGPDRAEPLPEDCTLVEEDGIWTLFYRGKNYVRLLDAKSRDDAEQQIAEMRFMFLEARVKQTPGTLTEVAKPKSFSAPIR